MFVKRPKPDATEFVQVFNSPTGRQYLRINLPVRDDCPNNWLRLDEETPRQQERLIRLLIADEKRRAGIDVPMEDF